MYDMNKCSTFWDEVPQTQFNIYVIRILLVTVLLLLSLLYMIISFILRKSISNLKEEDVSEAKLISQQTYYQVRFLPYLGLGSRIYVDAW